MQKRPATDVKTATCVAGSPFRQTGNAGCDDTPSEARHCGRLKADRCHADKRYSYISSIPSTSTESATAPHGL